MKRIDNLIVLHTCQLSDDGHCGARNVDFCVTWEQVRDIDSGQQAEPANSHMDTLRNDKADLKKKKKGQPLSEVARYVGKDNSEIIVK